MYRLLYISTARRPLSGDELASLLAQSRGNNRAAGVTGLLVAGGRRFLQALEGEKSAVEATYQRIMRDPRHLATVILSQQSVDAPLFADWAMAYQRGGETDASDLRTEIAALVGPIADATLRAYFEGFALPRAA